MLRPASVRTSISHDGPFGRVYFSLAGAFAVAVAVSIAGLAIRRFIVQPRWLGALSIESGVIALLIFLLMVTYLASWLWLPEDTVAGRVNWWLHTLSLLVFLPLIPSTKHLHLMLSPAHDFSQAGQLQRHSAARGRRGFRDRHRQGHHQPRRAAGLLLRRVRPLHRALPGQQHGKGAGSERRLRRRTALSAREWRERRRSRSSAKYVPDEDALAVHHLRRLRVSVPGRHSASAHHHRAAPRRVNTGKWEDDYGTKLFLNLERNGNSLGFPSSEREKFIEKNALPAFDGTQEYCLWLGCMGSYDPHGREIVLALVEVLNYLGVTFGVLKKENCTGDPVRRLGNDLLVANWPSSMSEQLKSSKAVKMLSICPHCVRTIAEDWKEVGARSRSSITASFWRVTPTSFRQAARHTAEMVFHDPCYLGRYRGIYEEPRTVIERSVAVVNPPRSHERCFCCGAGGGRMFLGEEEGKRVNVERAEQLVATGAPVVGAACPFCNTMLRDSLLQVSQAPPKLLDIAQIAAASLPRQTGGECLRRSMRAARNVRTSLRAD